jgi:diaminopimelate epimerase
MDRHLKLYKFQAYGNDFLVTEDLIPDAQLHQAAVALCDRHFGVGSDGLVTLKRDSETDYALRIINADGSEAGMSGNGGRCAAAYLHFIKGVTEKILKFSTTSGEKVYTLREWKGRTGSYKSLMGAPSFQPESIPFSNSNPSLKSIDDFLLTAPGLNEKIFALSVGNPQCVIFRDSLPDAGEQEETGRAVENHPFFPERTNVSFVRVLSRDHIKIKIWERGVGITTSSGTGSCGAGVAAISKGFADSRLVVETDTGRQIVEWQEGSSIILTGSVDFVAEIKTETETDTAKH